MDNLDKVEGENLKGDSMLDKGPLLGANYEEISSAPSLSAHCR